ncbi:hypothetical protein [Legionella norrlandica]|nr:hypothetical protein [Legionella norrlandica]
MAINFKEFQIIYNKIQAYNNITIRYTKEKEGQIIHKETKLYRKEGRFYLKAIECNETLNTKKIIQDKQEITKDSLNKQHAYISTLFSHIKFPSMASGNSFEGFKDSKNKLKWFIRYFLLDTELIGGLVGRIIAYTANKENKHYKTIPSNVLAKTLGPLIFPAGSKKPTIDPINQRGIIVIDSILHKQYKALRDYRPVYKNGEGAIRFKSKPVEIQLRKNDIKLETVIASNSLVKLHNNHDHLHVIYFSGNSGCFQQDHKMVAENLLCYEKDGLPVTAIQFNYPGILNSEGQVEIAQDLIDAGIAQVQSLLDQGVPHSKIVLHGVSLGGSIASHVAAHFHKLPKQDNFNEKQTLGGLYVSRTFASTAQVGRDFFNRALGDNILSRIISTFCLPLIKLGTWGSEWDLDTGKAFFSLPRDKRNYSVIISPKLHREKYRKEHRGTFFQELFDFILRRKKNPVDDAILRRGLHDSWEKKFEGYLIKCGYYGEKAKNNYPKENSYRKMMVVDFKKGQFAPDIDGHAKANYCYKQGNQYIDPKKKSKSIGLVHRATPVRKMTQDGNEMHVLPIRGNEAGEVARRSIAKMAR